MKVEVLIYAYLAVCASMILFNIACIFVFKKKDRTMTKRSLDFTEMIKAQFCKETLDPDHQKILLKKLRKINNMMAFDETLEQLYKEYPEQIKGYINTLYPVFLELLKEYHKKNSMQAAYFPYVIKKYNVFKGQVSQEMTDIFIEMVKDENIYCRENTMEALYSIGDADSVIYALKTLEDSGNYYHSKMITDGLLKFQGDFEKLDKKLWDSLETFDNKMKLSILDYFRFHSGDYCERFLQIMTDKEENDELRYSCIRYFGKYPYKKAYPALCEFVKMNSVRWEYTAITALTLSSYPCSQTEEILKKLLTSRNWYIRFNAAESLERVGVDYDHLTDIFEGKDRYASEMLRYKMQQKKLAQKERIV